ncbi:Trans-acting regulatory protein HvrA [wastewater metagenome]|uniref:Trans-acting regulatory protein HvrA n=2 Tax=unclassified sequences TaxID=12908 RepID=A0A5B8R8G2_9ZZZZ|nr:MULTISPECIES: H-NS histone family protein [Arhodomonas]MCS4504693.1 H-NS histone family protein [Arhodomonas aquaeolei]QEA04990.1 trans-acting regulatory protein HvrA [uncultured organism]
MADLDLSKYDSQQLRELKKDIDKALESRRRDDAKKAQQELKQVAERYGFNLNELVAGQGTKQTRRRSGGKAPAQFRHPEDETKTWSGRGRKPVWVKEWEAAGRSLEDLRIK